MHAQNQGNYSRAAAGRAGGAESMIKAILTVTLPAAESGVPPLAVTSHWRRRQSCCSRLAPGAAVTAAAAFGRNSAGSPANPARGSAGPRKQPPTIPCLLLCGSLEFASVSTQLEGCLRVCGRWLAAAAALTALGSSSRDTSQQPGLLPLHALRSQADRAACLLRLPGSFVESQAS